MNKPQNIKLRLGSTTRAKLHGIFTRGIPYDPRNPSGDWSPYFGQYEGQKKDYFDTQSCWAYAGNEVLEDQCEYLWKTGQFSVGDMSWFHRVGFIDEDGDFYFSRRFIPTLSGVKDTGNDEAEFWRLTKIHGAIPNKMLPYTNKDEYFDVSKITVEMRNVGEHFLKLVNIRYEELGRRWSNRSYETFEAALKQGELQIGIPVGWNWNQVKVKWDGNKQPAHSVALYKVDRIADPEYPYFVYDQYSPMLKQLSKDYYIPIATRAVIYPKNVAIPVPLQSDSLVKKIWNAIAVFLGFEARDIQVPA